MLLSKSKRSVFLFMGAVGITLQVLTAPGFCARFPDAGVLARTSQIQVALYNDRYAQARRSSDSLVQENETNPFAQLISAGVLLTEMKEKEQNLYPERLFSLLEEANRLAFILTNVNDRTTRAWAYLALGHTWAYRSLWEARFGSAGSAYSNGKKAKEYYELGLQADPKLYDLYAAMGEYNYWKSTKAGFLRSIGLISNERNEGIYQMQLAADSSALSRESARRGLMWIYVDAEKYDSALTIASDMHMKYPGGRVFVWALAQIYFAQQKFEWAIESAKEMRSRITAPPENYHKMISVDFLIANAYLELNRPNEASKTALQFTKYARWISEEVRSEQKDKIKFLKELAESD